jgi:predicted XRE-type DNA-binding protein
MPTKDKPLAWIASSKKNLMALPLEVRKFFGHVLDFAQRGDKHDAAKVLKGFGGAGVLELVEDDQDGTYRAISTVNFAPSSLPRRCLCCIASARRASAVSRHPKRIWTSFAHGSRSPRRLLRSFDMTKKTAVRTINGVEVEMGSGNVFADLGLPDADKLKIKSGLVIEITKAMRKLGLTQKAAAERMGIPQPKVSAMLRGDFTNLSERKLMDCLNRLGYDIEIKVRPAAEPVGHLMLAFA